jgi:hypothetical protein
MTQNLPEDDTVSPRCSRLPQALVEARPSGKRPSGFKRSIPEHGGRCGCAVRGPARFLGPAPGGRTWLGSKWMSGTVATVRSTTTMVVLPVHAGAMLDVWIAWLWRYLELSGPEPLLRRAGSFVLGDAQRHGTVCPSRHVGPVVGISSQAVLDTPSGQTCRT